MGDREYHSAGEILGPWLGQIKEKEELMKKKGAEGGTLPEMGGGAPPIPEENVSRVMGRLVKQPLTREVTGGHKMATFMLKVPRSYHNGEREVTENAYVPVVAWRAIAEQAEPLGKDSAVAVEGYLRTWANPEGKGFRWQLVAEGFEVLERREPVKDAGRAAAEAEQEEAAAAA